MTELNRPGRGGLALIALIALIGLAPLVAQGGTPINQRAAADASGEVEISNTAGSVTVTGWSRSEVEVTGELGSGVERLEFATEGPLTRIKVILPGKSSRVEASNLEVKVPAGSSLAVNTVSADIKVAGVGGWQRLQSVSGDVGTEAGAQDVECKTVSGDVEIAGTGKAGLVTVTTVSGDASMTNVAGEVNGNTVSGNFTIAMGEASRSRLRSTSGDLGLKARLAGDARLDVESISGDVRLDLDGPVAAEFDLSSFNGDIDNCFGPAPVRTASTPPAANVASAKVPGVRAYGSRPSTATYASATNNLVAVSNVRDSWRIGASGRAGTP